MWDTEDKDKLSALKISKAVATGVVLFCSRTQLVQQKKT